MVVTRQSAPKKRCPSDETLMLFVDGVLEKGSQEGIRSHVDDCDACRELLAQAARADESRSGEVPVSADPASSSAGKRRKRHLQAGDVVGGKYRVESVIGAGGMGHVFAARHLELDRRVAIKVMLPEMLAHADSVTRFIREAKAAGALRSEHAVRIFDIGRLESEAPYIVMEHLEGEDLGSRVDDGPLPVGDAVSFILQACDAIAEAHDAGIVHRDIKPANLFLTTGRDGEPFVKVLDFGLAKDVSPMKALARSGVTQTNVMLGSPLYMSPDQIRSSRDVDQRTDVWSLGATLYHLVAGLPPFIAPDVALVCQLILRGKFEPLSAHRDDVPEALEEVIRRCLCADLKTRYQNGRELAQALKALAPSSAATMMGGSAPVLPAAPAVPAAPVAPAKIDSAALAVLSHTQAMPLPTSAVAQPALSVPMPPPVSAQAPAPEPVRKPIPFAAMGIALVLLALIGGLVLFVVVRGVGAGSASAHGLAPSGASAESSAEITPVPMPLPTPAPTPTPTPGPSTIPVASAAVASVPVESAPPKRDPRPAAPIARPPATSAPTAKRNAYDHL